MATLHQVCSILPELQYCTCFLFKTKLYKLIQVSYLAELSLESFYSSLFKPVAQKLLYPSSNVPDNSFRVLCLLTATAYATALLMPKLFTPYINSRLISFHLSVQCYSHNLVYIY